MQAAELVHRAIEAINRGNPDAYAAQYAVDAVVHDPLVPDPLEGREAIAGDIAVLLRAFPNLRGTVRSVIADGDAAAAEVTFTGAHDGPLETPDGAVGATGRRVTFALCGRFEVDADGLISGDRRYYDVAGLLAQLGCPA